MIRDNRIFSNYMFDTLPRFQIKIKRVSGYTYDTVTKKRTPSYSTQSVWGYVGNWDMRTIQRSEGKLAENSKKVIIPYTTIDTNSLIEIGGQEYSIAFMQTKDSHIVLGVNPK